MGNDIFGYKRNGKPKGVFSMEESILTLGSAGSVEGAMIQTWRVDYAQDVQELFELGSASLYWMKGRPRGSGQMGRVIGLVDADSPNKGFFPAGAYDICKGGETISISAQAPVCYGGSGKSVSVEMQGVVVTSLGFSMQVADMMIQENVGWRFAKMTVN